MRTPKPYCETCDVLWDAVTREAPKLTLTKGSWRVVDTPSKAYRLASDALHNHRMTGHTASGHKVGV